MAALVFGLTIVSGCVPVMIGGAAAGGYYVGKDKRSVSVIANDASITTKIKADFVKDPDVSALKINIDTYQGVVTLRGEVPDYRTANRAVSIAKRAPGVKRVVSYLNIGRRY